MDNKGDKINDNKNYLVVPSVTNEKFKQINDRLLKTNEILKKNTIYNTVNALNKTSDIINNSIRNCYNNVFLTSQMDNLSNLVSKTVAPTLNGLSTTVGSIAKMQLSLINTKMIESLTNPLITVINRIAESQREIVNTIAESIKISNPLFDSFTKTIEEIKANPNSLASWLNYYDKLSEFFWILPYQMDVNELHEVLKTIQTEQEFDRYILKYFNKSKINFLLKDNMNMLNRKQDKKLFEQIILAYNNKSYALANIGLISMIDNLLSYYLIDKGCVSRLNLFEPIIKDLDSKNGLSDDFIFIVMMINSNINLLYENVEFNEKIKIKTNKKSRRNPVSHGKSYSNKKIDTIMLFNTMYYLLIAQNELKKYKSSLIYNRNKKEFYIPDKENKVKMKNQIKQNVKNKK